jgi:N-acyl homoserine lactone hydrolase
MNRLKTFLLSVVALFSACVWYSPVLAQSEVERLYVLNCGEAKVSDISTWSPGINVGEPRTFSNHCYLIRHEEGWMIWDAGVPDEWASSEDGVEGSPGVRGVVKRPLAEQLAEIGVNPEDVTVIAFSHAHFDHVGNAKLFTKARWIVQSVEHDAMLGEHATEFRFKPELYETLRNNPVTKIDGDHDVFGDGSVRVLSTPGHTPGHQSLLVRLKETGPVILSGDVAHFSENFDSRRVPKFNVDQGRSIASMDRVAEIAQNENATIWINHDWVQASQTTYSPKWYE